MKRVISLKINAEYMRGEGDCGSAQNARELIVSIQFPGSESSLLSSGDLHVENIVLFAPVRGKKKYYCSLSAPIPELSSTSGALKARLLTSRQMAVARHARVRSIHRRGRRGIRHSNKLLRNLRRHIPGLPRALSGISFGRVKCVRGKREG